MQEMISLKNWVVIGATDDKSKGIKNVWFQPGSFNDEVLEKAKSLGLNIEASHCAFVELQ